MMKLDTYGDAVFLQQTSLHLENDIMVIPAFRESTENKTLGYTVFRAKNRTVSEPLFLFYFSDSDFITPHYQRECKSSLRWQHSVQSSRDLSSRSSISHAVHQTVSSSLISSWLSLPSGRQWSFQSECSVCWQEKQVKISSSNDTNNHFTFSLSGVSMVQSSLHDTRYSQPERSPVFIER